MVMANEALRTKIDALAWEKERLAAENLMLRDENPEQAKLLDAEAELGFL